MEQHQIQSILNEIKNAEKLMKNTEREYNLIKKKFDKVNDWRYIDRLDVKIQEDKLQVNKLEKDNKKLKMDTKKGSYRIARNC